MNGSQVRKEDKLGREGVFMADNIRDFPPGSPVDLLTQEINAERQNISQFDSQQSSGFAGKRQAQEVYENRRDELISLLDKFGLAGAIVDDDIEGTAQKFRNPYPRTDQKLIARAGAFNSDAASIKDEMIDAGLDAGDFAALLTIRDDFRQAAAAHDSSEESHVEASGGMIDSFRKVMALSSRRDKRIKMKYRGNGAKLAAWATASHLDRAPVKKKDDKDGGTTPAP